MTGLFTGRCLALVSCGAIVLLAAGCGGSDGGATAPGDRGDFSVLTSSSGPELDADGYEIRVNDLFASIIGVNDSVQFGNRAVNTYTVELSDVADNCVVAGDNPRPVTVATDVEAVTTFEVSCTETAGVLQVVTETTGVDLDDGYTLSIDGSPVGTIGANDTVSTTDLVTGDHTVRLGEIALNCQLVGDPERTVAVPSEDSIETKYELLCTDRVGYVRVLTSTTGVLPDDDGYEVVIATGAPVPVPSTGVRTVGSVAAGVTTVWLLDSSLASNCHVVGENPISVTVPAGGLVEAPFEVACGAP